MVTRAHKKEIENVNILLAALQSVEWVEEESDEVNGLFYCPWCGEYKSNCHADDCQRQIAIDAVLPPK